MAEIKHGDNNFYVGDKEYPEAIMTYIPDGEGVIAITHTGVDPSLRGQGIGNQLVQAGVKYARENKLKINALCPFARDIIEADPKDRDILVAD